MAQPLDGVQAKLDRSYEHLDALVAEVGAFHDGKPYDTSYAPLGEGWYAVTFHVLREPPLRLGVIAGDYAQNLRAALDHLVYQLARLTKTSPHGTAFPIALSRAAYLEPGPKGEPSMRDRCLAGVAEQHRPLIDEVQPFNDETPAEDVLAHLGRFTNTDKHRVIHAVFGKLVSVDATPSGGPVNIELIPADPLPVLVEGTEVYRMRSTQLSEVNVNVEVDLNFMVAFGKEGLTDGDFRGIHRYVGGIIDGFRPIFA